MRTAQICPTCATYTNAVCVIYDGEYLSNINASPGDDLQTILASIDSTVSGLQVALGYVPEDEANKSTNVITDQASDTKYPSVKAVFDWVTTTFEPVLGFTPEDVTNKSTNVVTDQASNTKYPSVKAVFDWATVTFQPVLGFTPENVANKSTDNTLGGLTPSNTLYPTQKAVKDFVTTAIGAIDLQAVTDVGNSTTNEILHTSGSNGAIFSYNNGIQVYSLTNGGVKLGVDPVNKGYVSIGNGVGSAAALVKANNLTASRTHQLPNADGELVVSVNNITPVNGNVTIPLGNINTVKISLTSAQIQGLTFFAPLVLIPAPGAGKFLDILSITSVYNHVTTAYSTSNTLNFRLGPSGAAAAVLLGSAASFLSNAFNVMNKISASSLTTNITAIGSIANQPLIVDSGISSPTLGDGTVNIYIVYAETTF